jgi:hypothetical protein
VATVDLLSRHYYIMGKQKGKSAESGRGGVNVATPGSKVTSVNKKLVDKTQLAEIDTLFSTAKETKAKRKEEKTESDPATEKTAKRNRNTDESNRPYGVMKSEIPGVIVNPEAPLERIDVESGLPVYKAHLLKVGEGGGTPLCPFDCNCCF